MTTILGLDISSVQLNGCLLVDDQAPVLRAENLGKSSEPLIERVRRVDVALLKIVTRAPTSGFVSRAYMDAAASFRSPDWIVIEDAFGKNRNADRALNRVIGAIIASCPRESQIALVSTGDWRRALGSKNTKADGHEAVKEELWRRFNIDDAPYNEHELDATGIAFAWGVILASQATPDKAPPSRASSTHGDT